MLASTILNLLEENIQNMDSFVYANILPQELANQFDRIANKFVDAHLKPSLAGSLQGIDEVELNIDSLRNLKTTTTLVTALVNGDYEATLPNTYRNLLRDSIKVSSSCGTGNFLNVPSRVIGDESWDTTKRNPFSKPKEDSPISKIIGNKFIISGTRPMPEVTITYIRQIVALDSTGVTNYVEFPEEVILTLIDLTRNRVLESLQGERLPSAVQETGNFGTM